MSKEQYYQDVRNFNDQLTVGLEVEVRWTNNGHFNHAVGRVAKLNRKTVKVALNEPFTNGLGTWPAGFQVLAPRPLLFDPAYTVNNGVFPLGGVG